MDNLISIYIKAIRTNGLGRTKLTSGWVKPKLARFFVGPKI